MSLKITINDEEVVSNSNLQIKEEMLSTSSTILKNCYPKSWEEDKDYISRYYFPKDYSKCKITNETYYPEDPGIIVKGSNLNINYDNSKSWELKGFFGDTLQDGTPTPSSPVPIQSVTGLQNITIQNSLPSGYMQVDYIESTGTQYIELNKKLKKNQKVVGEIEFNTLGNQSLFGTYSGNYIETFGISSSNKWEYRDAALNWQTSNAVAQVNTKYNIELYYGATSQYLKINNSDVLSTSGTHNNNISSINAFLFARNNNGTPQSFAKIRLYSWKIYDSDILSLDLVPCFRMSDNVVGLYDLVNNVFYENNGSGVFTYGSVIGNTYEVNLGKNLFNANNNTYNDTNVTHIIDNTNKITVTNSYSWARLETTIKNLTPNTNYTISTDITNESDLKCGLWGASGLSNLSTNTNFKAILTKQSDSSGNLKFYFYVNYSGTTTSTGTVIFDNIQIEKGSQATSYSPYFTPIELNKIGTYQDSIKKSTGKNLCNEIFESGNISDSGEETTSSTTYRSTDYYSVKGGETLICSYNATTGTNLNWCACYDSNKNFLRRLTNIKTNPFTISNDTVYIRLGFYKSGSITRSDFSNVMLNEGSTALPYEPYGKVWYIENKNIKITLDSNTTFVTDTIPSGNPRRFIRTYQGVIVTPANNDTKGQGYSNVGIVTATNTALGTARGIAIHPNGNLYIDGTTYSNIANTPVILIVPLKTPTYTEITNEELISQLEAMYQSQLYNGINNISVNSENLSSSLEIHYNFNEEYTIEDLIFCGCIKNTGRISLNPREPHYCDLQILDFKTLLSEGDCLNYVISNKTISEAINQVVSSISNYGFVVGNIQLLNPDEIIGAYSTLNKTAYDVFQYFADITQSRWTTRMIDENTIAIDFYDPTLMPQGTQIQSTTEFYENNDIVDISFNYSTNDYRNKQIMTSDEVFANITQTQTIIADGYTKNFMCENKIGLITNITLNGVEQSFITKNEEQLGYSGDFIYQPGENTFISTNTISAGGIIVITYYPIVKGREIILNSNESGRIETQIGRKGIISRYENRNDSTSSQELQKIGQSYIKYKGQAEITLKIVSTKDIWNIGQIVNYNAPLEELTTDYMVKSKSIDMYLNAGKIFYTYELTSNFNYENAVNYFDNQRAKNQGNIGEGETITRNIDLESTALIKFYDTAIEEIQVQNPTSLDFALDGVLI